MNRNSGMVIATDRTAIKEYVTNLSDAVAAVLTHDEADVTNTYSYLLIKKSITHSDLITAGKGNERTGVAKNYLYYLSTEEMEELELLEGNNFIRTAHQSNITLPKEFYDFLGIPLIQRRQGKQVTQHQHPLINNYAKVFLVNDCMKYFDIDYTKLVFDKLHKTTDWNYAAYKVTLVSGDFTSIRLTYAIHGIGAQEDIIFHKLRRSIFRGDNLALLLRSVNGINHVYVMLEKNPKFFTIIGEGNEAWENYLTQHNKKQLFDLLKSETSLVKNAETKTRKYQAQWRQLLAQEMMNYTANDNEVFCPLTYITADFNRVGALFVASHIKEYANCTLDEAFDINNGILIVANADALFDKHLITIENDGTVVFSFLLENDFKLRQELKLTEKVFQAILTPGRCKYLEYHRQVFAAEEARRKTAQYSFDDLSSEIL